ncbi:MAG: hypothetical protein D8M58_04615 [Calditrichaeota bacterium]|nr:MAG: hypothetical protein DWQ03_02460 [Calditrichota bacterium]MBL1204654.1 hypothetical protein [Calditrichota bacterium]NOG44482.1 hypothetical protein [Calditrichota bacterium]
MEVQPDFKELLKLFNAHKVEYVIVGGYALAFHGAPRYTGDIDLLVKPDKENSNKIISVLAEFGFGSLGLSAEDFQSPDRVIQLGVPPIRIDIITSITGVETREIFSKKIEGMYGDVPVKYIDRQHLIINKRCTGRKKDLSDLEALGEDL